MRTTTLALGLAAALAIAAALVAPAVVTAQQGPMQMPGMMQGHPMQGQMPGMMQGQMPGMHGQAAGTDAGDDGPSSRAYRAASDKMHAAMSIAWSGNADRDFARAMIPHHQGAIDMARAVIEYGSDPDIRTLAEEVIRAQEAEIAVLEAWLAENGG